MRLRLLLLVSLAVSGCAGVQVLEPNLVTEKVGRTPQFNATTTTPVGGTVYTQFRYWSKIGYRLTAPVSTGLGLGRVSAAIGDFVLKSNADGKVAFCTETRAYSDPLTGPLAPACFLDKNQSGSFTHVTAAPSVIWFEKELPMPVKYESSELVVPRSDAFRYELLFQGVSNKTLRLSYREFSNDLARPAYFQDVSYDLPPLPTTVSFRSVRIEIVEAGNNGLTYRILSGF